MYKLLMALLILSMVACSTIQAKAVDKINNEELEVFCETNIALLYNQFHSVINSNERLCNMLHKDMGDFVPVLFSQSKMENLAIVLYSTLTEMLHVAKDRKVSNAILDMLDQYIDLLRYDMIKAKMFEGMIANTDRWKLKTKNQLALKIVAVNLKIGYDLLVDIKKGLEELK